MDVDHIRFAHGKRDYRMAACADAYAETHPVDARTLAQLPNLLLHNLLRAHTFQLRMWRRESNKASYAGDTDDEMLESMMHNIRKAMDMVG